MADRVSARNAADEALKSIMDQSAIIAQELGKEPPTFTQRNRDKDYLRMVQLREVDAWLKEVSQAIAPKQKVKTR